MHIDRCGVVCGMLDEVCGCPFVCGELAMRRCDKKGPVDTVSEKTEISTSITLGPNHFIMVLASQQPNEL